MLVGRRQSTVERQHLGGVAGGRGGVLALQGVGGVANLGLAGEKDEHVAVGLPFELIESRGDALDVVAVDRGSGIRRVVIVVDGGLRHERPVANLHGKGAAGHLDDGRRGAVRSREMFREAGRVDGGGGDDELEIGAFGQQLPQVAEQKVDVEAALVRLIDDDRVVLAQHAIAVDLIQEDTVGHQLDAGIRADLVGEPHLVTDQLADLLAELFGDAFGDGARGEPTRLGVADVLAAEFEADLGQLGGLARPGRSGDDHDLVVANSAGDVLPALADRQFGGEGDIQRFHEASMLLRPHPCCASAENARSRSYRGTVCAFAVSEHLG